MKKKKHLPVIPPKADKELLMEPNTLPEGDEQDETEDQSAQIPIDTEDISDWYHDGHEDQVDMSKIERRKKRNTWPWIFGGVGILIFLAALVFSYTWYQSNRPVQNGRADLAMQVSDKTASGEAITLELTYSNQDTVSLRTGKIEVVYPEGFEFQSATPAPTTGNTTWEVNNLASGHGGKIYITGQLVGEVGSQKQFSAFFTYRPENLNYDFQASTQQSVSITSSTISVTLDSPKQARTGQEIEIRAEFKNNSKTPLKNIQVKVMPPAGFTLNSSDPSVDSPSDLTWKFDELDPQASQTVSLKGVVTGDSGQEQAFIFQAGFIEIDGRFNQQIEKQALILLTNPSVDLKIEAPASVAPGAELIYTLKVTNTADIDLKDVKLRLLVTGDFFQDDSIEVPTIGELKPNDAKTLTVKTTLKSDVKARDLNLSAVLSVRSVTVDGEQTTVSGTATVKTTVAGSLGFSSQVRYFNDDLNKIGDGPVPPKVGEQTTYVIWWDVTSGPSDLKQLTLSAKLPADVTFEAGDRDITFEKKSHTISYTGSTLSAGDIKHLSFSVSIIPTEDDFNGLMILLEAANAQAIDTSSNETLTADAERLTTNLDGDPVNEGKGVVE